MHRLLIHLAAATAWLGMLIAPAAAASFGTLSNFDVVNDTGHECHGFEIELEDIGPDDVPYAFGGSYSRYGAPEIIDATSDPAHPRVIVRYRQWSGSAWAATPVAPAGISPRGHDCFAGGPVGNYLDSGCEHFGVSLGANPTRTTYRWLVAAEPDALDSAFTAEPQPIEVPIPVWDVIPAGDGQRVDVRAELEPVEEEQHAQYGEPQWMKVYKIESERDLRPEDLNLLLLGIDGGLVPDDETEIESEWKLIQSKPGDAEEDEEDADVREERPREESKSIVRRYEFFAYVGPRDPENNEAMPCVDDDAPVPADAPVEGCVDLGDFVGAQNVAVDLAVENAPTPTATAIPTGTVAATATATAEATPTATPPAATCTGDCNGDDAVGISELITLVRIALGDAALSECAAGDGDANGEITITDLISSVARALTGCSG